MANESQKPSLQACQTAQVQKSVQQSATPDLLQLISALQAKVTDLEAKLAQPARPLTPSQLIDHDAELKAFKEYAGKTALERTQMAADAAYGTDGKRFKCVLTKFDEEQAKDVVLRDLPAIVVSANSPEEAEVRYLRICNVIRTDHKVLAVREAQQANAA